MVMRIRCWITAALLPAVLVACVEQNPMAPAEISPQFSKKITVAAEQAIIDWTVGGLALYPLDTEPHVYGAYKQNIAQTFQLASDARLLSIALPVACEAGVRIRIQLRAGLYGAMLYDASFDPETAAVDGGFKVFESEVKVRMRAGVEYALVLSSDPAAAADPARITCGIFRGPAYNSYAGGRAYYTNSGYTPYWIPTPTGVESDDQDIPFRILAK